MQRNDARMLGVRFVGAMLTYVPFMLIQGSVAALLPPFWALPWTILVVYYSVTRVPYVVADWATTRWSADEHGLRLRSGWPLRSDVTVPWHDMGSLHAQQSYVARLFGVHRLTAVVGAESRSTLVLEALTAADVQRLTAWHAAPAAPRPTPIAGDEAGAEQESDAVLYRARPRDFFLIGFTHGQFLLLIPFVWGTGTDLLGLVGLDLADALGWAERWGAGPVVAGAVVLALAYGTLRASLTYRGYTVRQHAWGYTTAGGLVQRDRREARLEHVVGVRVDRNPLMQLTGHCSVHLILATGRGDKRPLPVLPLVRVAALDPHLARLLPEPTPQEMTRRAVLEPLLVLAGAGAAATAAWFWVSPWLAGLLLLVGAWAANALATRLGRNASTVWIDTGVVGRSVRIVAASAVRTVSFLALRVPRPAQVGWLRLLVLDRRARQHHIPGVPTRLARTFDVVPRRRGRPSGGLGVPP